MDSLLHPNARSGFPSPRVSLSVVILMVGISFFQALHADTAPPMDLKIIDEGSRIVLSWKFHYPELPPTFILREKESETISLQDPQTLNQSLSDVISVAFDLKLDGKQVQPITAPQLTISPNKNCRVMLIYPGHPGAHLELRIPVLQYLPDSYLMNYEIINSRDISMALRGSILGRKGLFPEVVQYTQASANGSTPTPPSSVKSSSSASFKSEIGAAWINYNWLFICVVLLLMQMPKRIVLLIVTMMACWIFLCLLWVSANYKFPYHIPELALALPTVLLCWITIRHPEKYVWLTLVTLAAGMLNACYDLQQIPLSNLDKATPALIGLCLGFISGMVLVLVVLVPLLWECKKFPEFQTAWAPRICWIIAGLAVLVPLQKLFFK